MAKFAIISLMLASAGMAQAGEKKCDLRHLSLLRGMDEIGQMRESKDSRQVVSELAKSVERIGLLSLPSSSLDVQEPTLWRLYWLRLPRIVDVVLAGRSLAEKQGFGPTY